MESVWRNIVWARKFERVWDHAAGCAGGHRLASRRVRGRHERAPGHGKERAAGGWVCVTCARVLAFFFLLTLLADTSQ